MIICKIIVKIFGCNEICRTFVSLNQYIMYTKEQIQHNLSTNPKWIERSLIVLYERQTYDEQHSGETTSLNGIGFNSYNSDVFGVSITPLTNVWMHFAVNFYRNDYTQGTIFVNGVRQNLTYFLSNMNAGNVVFGDGQMRIGAGGDGYYGVWRFNNVKVYNRNLSDFEIKQNYNSLKSRFNL